MELLMFQVDSASKIWWSLWA